MQQQLAELLLNTPSTQPRNDESWCEGRGSRPSHRKYGMTYVCHEGYSPMPGIFVPRIDLADQ
jgi:hypothetical protein